MILKHQLGRFLLAVVLILFSSIPGQSQERYAIVKKKKLIRLEIERYGMPSVSGDLLRFTGDTIVLAEGTLSEYWLPADAYSPKTYWIYEVSEVTYVPLPAIETVTFRRHREGAVVGGALGGAWFGVIIFAYSWDERSLGGILMGAAVGAGLGYGISILTKPKTSKIKAKEKKFNQLKYRLKKNAGWPIVPRVE